MDAKELTKRAKQLRHNQTESEQKIWYYLRAKRFQGLKFKRQYVITPYIVDFVCFEKMLVIEIDGGQHDENRAYDDKRSQFLESKGFKVVRFWNNEVLCDIQSVLSALSLTLSPRRGNRSSSR